MSDPSEGRAAASPAGSLVERLRSVHLKMVDAVLGGDGLQQVAALAAEAAGAPVAIVVPRLDAAVAAGADGPVLEAVRRYVADRVRDRPSQVPEALAAEAPIQSGDDVVGAVVMLHGEPGAPEPLPEAGDFLHLAAVACLTEVAVEEAKEEVEQNLRGSFLEDLRSRPDLEPREVVRRAARLGCDLARGAVVLCAELTTDRPRHVIATITGDEPGALAEHLDGRVYAILPGTGGDDAPEGTTARGRALATRLRRHGTVGVSSFYSDPAELPRAIQEAELVLDVLKQGEGGGWDGVQDIGTGTYRLLFRVLASHPEEVRSFYEDTVAPIVRYDDQYRTDLVGTLEAYLEQNCNMNATASAIYAHRHTVAYRLERVKELTGLDPMLSEDRERLGLGLKAYRIIAPRLPK
ncbi:PucR family transcriptional regulator [Conexibacter woesei]|uniref:PucR family transcriptional regulator n=1 Tax=Conexibacter woesei TaxID=191495 RepID=UPI0012DE73EF|nr:helix-turn-helix domain-containing protein [Conexibacter woesei]